MSKKITIEDGFYEVGGGLGCWARSTEPHVQRGSVRFIGGVLMSAYRVTRKGLVHFEVWWTPTDRAIESSEKLREWVAGL